MNTYTTKDLGEAAALLSTGFKLLDTQWKEETAYFVFDKGDEAKKVAYQFNFGGLTVVAKTFHDNVILIKRKILARYNPKRFRKDVRNYAYNQR